MYSGIVKLPAKVALLEVSKLNTLVAPVVKAKFVWPLGTFTFHLSTEFVLNFKFALVTPSPSINKVGAVVNTFISPGIKITLMAAVQWGL